MTKGENPLKINTVKRLDGEKTCDARLKRAGGWCEPVGGAWENWPRSVSPEIGVGRTGWHRYLPQRVPGNRRKQGGTAFLTPLTVSVNGQGIFFFSDHRRAKN